MTTLGSSHLNPIQRQGGENILPCLEKPQAVIHDGVLKEEARRGCRDQTQKLMMMIMDLIEIS